MDEIEQKIVELSWKIIEAKYWYYFRDDPKMQDVDYDMMEKDYENFCMFLGVEPTASNMVGFDETRPCCQQVMTKFGRMKASKR